MLPGFSSNVGVTACLLILPQAAELERQLYPDTTRKLSKAEQEAFYNRLFEDTERRARNRCGLVGEGSSNCCGEAVWAAPWGCLVPCLSLRYQSCMPLLLLCLYCLSRDGLAEKAKADAMAKLMKSAPAPRRRPASAAAGGS